jgi:hypothetical protein
MAQIKSFGVLQTAKFSAVLYFIFTAIFMVPFGLFTLIGRGDPPFAIFGAVLIIFMPVIYACLGFIFVAIGCLVYNAIAKHIGGIEIEIE